MVIVLRSFDIKGDIEDYEHVNGNVIDGVIIVNKVKGYEIHLIVISHQIKYNITLQIYWKINDAKSSQQIKQITNELKKVIQSELPGKYLISKNSPAFCMFPIKIPDNIVKNPDMYVNAGDIIIKESKKFGVNYEHYGIYCGNSKMIHIYHPRNTKFNDGIRKSRYNIVMFGIYYMIKI